MRRLRTTVGGAVTCALVALAPAAWAGHGVAIQKTCVGPAGSAKARTGDPITCRITVTNRDTLNDTLRLDQIVDVIDDAAGPTVTPNLLQQDLGVPCVLLAPGAAVTVTHQFTAGDPENDPLPTAGAATGADLRNGGTAVPAGCPPGGLGFSVAFGAQVDIVECLDGGDCALGSPCSTDACIADACVHDPKAAGTVCRASRGVCDPAEACSGADLSCPPDAKRTDVCRPTSGACDVAELCNGVDDGCPADAFAPSTTVCRTAAGVCDVEERCTGSGPACPADAYVASGAVCRSAAGVCDVAEKCTGGSVGCPADVKRTGTCRPSVDDCDVPEACDGGSNDCPVDRFAPSTVTCRAAAGPCDLRESCSGAGPSCPPDAVKPTGTLCRTSAGACDVDESCDGSSTACPPDQLKSAGAPCPDDGNACTRDVCNGTSASCTHPSGNAGTECRAANPARQCDLAEACSGASISCPADGLKPAGTPCDKDGDRCTVDQCDAGGACVVVGDSNDPTCPVCGQTATGACTVTVDGVAGVFTSLQAGVNAAPNGGTIHVAGVCKGVTLVKKRASLTIEGVAPPVCPPGRRDLTATLQGDPNAVLPSGSNGEVLKLLSSNNIIVRYLNIVNGSGHDGLELKTSSNATGYCNCVANNVNGIELDGPGGHLTSRNLVLRNSGIGIRVHGAQVGSSVVENLVEQNGTDGIVVNEASNYNDVSDNVSRTNGQSGILLDNGDLNTLVGNDVHHNTVAGIRLKSGSDGNTIGSSAAPNLIHDNGDGLTNLILCVGDLTGNAGTNVPATPACQ